MTQKQLGQALGFKGATQIRQLEQGKREPTLSLLPKIQDVLKLVFHDWEKWQELLRLYGLK